MKTRLFWVASITILAALLLTGAVFAEGEEPPVVPTEEPSAVAVEAPPAVEEPAPAEAPAVAEEPLVTVEGPNTPSEPVAVETEVPVIEAQVVVVDAAGEPMDMASQESAQVIAAADPYFTVGLITYRFSEAMDYCVLPFDLAHCFDGNTGFNVTDAIQDTINYIRDNPLTIPTNGMIYVKADTYGKDVEIDGSYLNLRNLKGLIGEDGSLVTIINGSVTISNLLSGFTLSGFTINGAVEIDYVTGVLNLTDLTVHNTGGTGISVTNHKGHINLTNVKSSYNKGSGAVLENSTTGNVTITNSSFDGNGNPGDAQGLSITTNGIVTINGLSTSRNFGTGLSVSGFSSLTLNNAVLNLNTGSNGYGLDASTTRIAPVTLRNAIANDNKNYGLNVATAGSIAFNSVDTHRNNTGINLDNSNGTGTVTLTSVRSSDNLDITGSGIHILARGAITLTSVSAYQNHGSYGVYINNNTGTGSVTVTSPAASGSAGANSFWGNTAGVGLYIYSNGAVTVTNTNAYSNGSEGLYILNGTSTVTINKNLTPWLNSFWDNRGGILINTQGAVNISSSTAYNNHWTGIEVTGKGAITLTDVEAFNNGLAGGGVEYSGLKLTNTDGTGGVTIKSSVPANYLDFSDNYYYGIAIYSKGVVSVSNVTINNTTMKFGLLIENQTSGTSPAVTITNGGFNLNNWSGVNVKSKGAITLTNVTSTNSQNYSGVKLNNTYGTSSGVTIKSSVASVFYEFSKNAASGIEIYSNGAVAVSNAIAEGNGIDGIYIQNSGAGSNLPVNVSNSLFNGNSQNGLTIASRGAITLTNVGASENISGRGAWLENWMGGNAGVTIRSTSSATYYGFDDNNFSGIYIFSYGAVSVGNVTANENGNYGLEINRNGGTGAISVTRSTFDHNTFGGAWIYTTPFGVTLTDVTASYNDPTIGGNEYSGVYIEDGGTVVVKSSTTSAMYAFSNNTDHGLDIISTGSITISNVIGEGNRNANINIENQAANNASPKPVSVTRSTANHSVNGNGFFIATKGNVTLNTVTANENLNGYGLYVNAGSDSLIPASVTMTGARNEFSTNGVNGIYIRTEGNISLSNTIADENTGYGIYLWSAAYTDSTGNVTISASTNFWNSASSNFTYGLQIFTNGTVSITRLRANDNGDYGVSINNHSSNELIKNVTLTSVEVNRNHGQYGLYISSLGAVVLNSTRADSNEQNGIRIDTNGAITFNGVSASYNSTHEADIPAASASISERLTSDSEGDIWHFTGTTSAYNISLTSTDFNAYLKIYHWNTIAESWDLVASNDNSGGGTNALISIPGGLVNGDEYYVLATTADQWGTPGDYTLGFNTPGTAYSYQYFGGAYIDNHSGTGNVSITSPTTFWSAFNENNYIGLFIISSRAVSITNTDAGDNGDDGVYVWDNYHPTNVTIRNTLSTRNMSFSNNGGFGIRVPSAYGAITISGLISASDNRWTGAYLRNNGVSDLTPMAVTITSLTTNGNGAAGIDVISKGNITLSSITANNNQDLANGVVVDNHSDSSLVLIKGNVTMNGSNIISGNYGDGLSVNTAGILSIIGVRAENNLKSGLVLKAYTAGKSVMLTNVISQYNKVNGVSLTALGTATLTDVRSCVNGTASAGGEGIYVNTNNAYHIYINNSTAIGNVGGGIRVLSHKPWLHLLGTFYYGNNTDNINNELDLYYLTTP